MSCVNSTNFGRDGGAEDRVSNSKVGNRATQGLPRRDAARRAVDQHLTPHRHLSLPTYLPCSAVSSSLLSSHDSLTAAYSCVVRVCVCARVHRARASLPRRVSPRLQPPSGIHLRCYSHRVQLHRRRAYNPISYTALSRSSRRLVLCSERVVFEPFALPVVAVAYNLANLTDCTCLAATHAALALHVAHITLCIVHTASIHPRHHRDSIHQPHTADPSHLAHVCGTTPVLAHTYTTRQQNDGGIPAWKQHALGSSPRSPWHGPHSEPAHGSADADACRCVWSASR
jgi:hypothetical protein